MPKRRMNECEAEDAAAGHGHYHNLISCKSRIENTSTAGAGTSTNGSDSKRERLLLSDEDQSELDEIEVNVKIKTKNIKEPEVDQQGLIKEKLKDIKKAMKTFQTVEELMQAQNQLVEIRKYMQLKIQKQRAQNLENMKINDALQLSILSGNGNKPEHPLQNDVILENLIKYLQWSDLISSRLVCQTWNQAISTHIKRSRWVHLVDVCYSSVRYQLPHQPEPNRRRIESFFSCIPADSALFPMTKFTVSMYKVQPSITKFFGIFEEHIKALDLSYESPINAEAQQLYPYGLVKFLLPPILNCEILSLSNFSCQILANVSILVPRRMNLKFLEFQMNCKCTNDDNHNLLSERSFLIRLIAANPLLETFNITANSKFYNNALMKRILAVFQNLSNLKHITLKSTNLTGIDLDVQPANYSLQSLHLLNVFISPLKPFLGHHSGSLEELTIIVDPDLWAAAIGFTNVFNIGNYSPPRLPNLQALSVICLDGREDALHSMLLSKSALFPHLVRLNIANINDKFVNFTKSASSTNGQANDAVNDDNDNNDDGDGDFGDQNESDSDSDSDEVEEMFDKDDGDHIEVRHLEVSIDDSGDPPHDKHFLRHTFYGVQHLVITSNQSSVLIAIWTSQFRLKSLELRVLYEESENRNSKFFVQHLDTIITGFSINDCERIYANILEETHSTAGFQLQSFNMDWFESMCREKQRPSIRNLNGLQKFSLSCCRSSCRVTEVTLITLLVCVRSLTAIDISSCSINQKFIRNIREQLSPGFFLNIKGIE